MVFFPANFMLQAHHHEEDNDNDDQRHQPHMTTSLTPNILPLQDFHGGVGSFLGKRSSSSSSMSFSSAGRIHDEDQLANNGDHGLSDEEEDDDGSQLGGPGGGGGGGEKKRRLNMEQVKTLEKNFELGNKLDPDRKLQLARALGLQPRQIAIWFQNRRARWKTKQLEKDYDQLKRHFQSIQAENDSLQSQNNKLQGEILALKNREPTESINLNKETEGSCSNPSENCSSDIKPSDMNSRRTTPPPIDSHPNIITSRPLFPASHSNIRPPTHVAQLLFQGNNNNNNSSSARPDLQCHKIDPHQTVKEESFCNMFCGIDDQTGFWPWLEQHHFN